MLRIKLFYVEYFKFYRSCIFVCCCIVVCQTIKIVQTVINTNNQLSTTTCTKLYKIKLYNYTVIHLQDFISKFKIRSSTILFSRFDKLRNKYTWNECSKGNEKRVDLCVSMQDNSVRGSGRVSERQDGPVAGHRISFRFGGGASGTAAHRHLRILRHSGKQIQPASGD